MTHEQLKQAVALIRAGWEPDDTDKLYQPGAYPTWAAPDGRRMTFEEAVKEINKDVKEEIKREVKKEVKKEVGKEITEVKKEMEANDNG